MRHLCRAIIWSACFLEFSDDDTIDPDSAVKALEDIATSLQEATEEEKLAFIAACSEEADALQKTGGAYEKTAQYIRDLPNAVGIREEKT